MKNYKNLSSSVFIKNDIALYDYGKKFVSTYYIRLVSISFVLFIQIHSSRLFKITISCKVAMRQLAPLNDIT